MIVVVDSRLFSDPTEGRRHIGFDAWKVVGVVGSSHFVPTLEKLAADLSSAVRHRWPEGRILVVVYCRKGVHRSVAFGYVSRCLLAECPREVEMLPSHHASERIWHRDYCGERESCRTPTAERSDAITRASRVWHSLRLRL